VSDKREVTIRRAPRLPVFLVIGGAVGAIVTLIVTSLYPADPHIGFAATFGYFLLYGVPTGVALGAIVGLVIDRVSASRAKTVTVEREVVGEDPEGGATPQPARKKRA
jgi:hypothetical protein